MIDWDWVSDHLDELVGRTLQHLGFTLATLVIGFAISFALSLWAVRRRRLYAPITVVAGILYTIPSIALFSAMVPITGLTVLTAIIPLVLYTILIFVRNIVAGFDAVPVDVEEAADGMGYTRRQRLRAVDLPLALPLIVAGVRVASVSTIGLVTVTGALGDRFGGLGFFIFEGYRRSFPTEILFGAIPAMILAIAVDLSLVGVQGRMTPWSKARIDEGMSSMDAVPRDELPGGAPA